MDEEEEELDGPLEVRHDRIIQSEVTLMSWCPKMDLLALVLKHSEIVIHRLNWQRARNPISIPSGSVTCLHWAPDGRSLAVGLCDGSVAIYDVQQQGNMRGVDISDEETFGQGAAGNLVVRQQVGEAAVTCMAWAATGREVEQKPQSYSLRNIDLTSHEQFNLLACGFADGTLSIFTANLTLELNSVQIFNSSIEGLSFLPDLSSLLVIVHSPLRFRIVSTRPILDLSNPIQELSDEVEIITGNLLAASAPLDKIFSSYRALATNTRHILLLLAKSAAAYPEDDIAQVGGVPEMFTLIAHGSRSPAVSHYLMRSVTLDGTKKLDQSAKTFLADEVRLLTSKGGPAWYLQRVLARLSCFRAKSTSDLAALGISTQDITRAIESLVLALANLEKAALALESWAEDVQNFALWLKLISTVLWQQENENESLPLDKNDRLRSRPSGQSVCQFVAEFLTQTRTEKGGWGDFAADHGGILADLKCAETEFVHAVVRAPTRLFVNSLDTTEQATLDRGLPKQAWYGAILAQEHSFQIWQELGDGRRQRIVIDQEWNVSTMSGPILELSDVLIYSIDSGGKTAVVLYRGQTDPTVSSGTLLVAIARQKNPALPWTLERVSNLRVPFLEDSENVYDLKNCLAVNHDRGLASIRIGSRRLIVLDLEE